MLHTLSIKALHKQLVSNLDVFVHALSLEEEIIAKSFASDAMNTVCSVRSALFEALRAQDSRRPWTLSSNLDGQYVSVLSAKGSIISRGSSSDILTEHIVNEYLLPVLTYISESERRIISSLSVDDFFPRSHMKSDNVITGLSDVSMDIVQTFNYSSLEASHIAEIVASLVFIHTPHTRVLKLPTQSPNQSSTGIRR